MSHAPQGPGWWQASDHKWYPPEQHPSYGAPPPQPPMPPPAPQAAPPGPGYYSAGASGYPAPPGGPGYGAPAEPVVSIGAAFNYAVAKFQANAREILIAGAIGWLGVLVLSLVSYLVVWIGILGAGEGLDSGTMLFFIGFPLAALVPLVGNWLFQMVIIRGSLMIVNGQTPLDLKRMFSAEQVGSFLLGALLVSVLTCVGFVMCIIPGVIFLFFSAYWGYFLIGKQLSPVDSIKASFSFVNKNLGTLLLLFLACLIVYWLGALVCSLGLVIAVPLVVIAQGFMWRRLQGEPVAP